MVTVTVAARTLAVGDPYQGGIVAYILEPGDPGYSASVQHGLIAATADQSAGIIWATADYQSSASSGAYGMAIGTGNQNTIHIVAQNGAGTTYAAGLARACADGGYNDWYLPSRDELDKLYVNRAAIGGFNATAGSWYWSSSEQEPYPNGAESQDFANGLSDYWLKSLLYRVRAVRAF